MTTQRSKVLHVERPTREAFAKCLKTDWERSFPSELRGQAAGIMGCSKKTIGNAVGEIHAPDSYTLVMSLLADPSALQCVLGLVGLKAVPLVAEAANDFSTLSEVAHLAGQFAEVLADGIRDHHETLGLAVKIRPLLPALSAIVAEADRLKGAA